MIYLVLKFPVFCEANRQPQQQLREWPTVQLDSWQQVANQLLEWEAVDMIWYQYMVVSDDRMPRRMREDVVAVLWVKNKL